MRHAADRICHFAALAVCAAGAACLSSCAPAPGSSAGDATERRQLELTGSSTIAPLASEIGKRFEARHSGVRINVQMGGSTRGVNDARNGLADIGMASRDLHEDEDDLHAFTIARDGICIIVHQENRVTRLTDEQIAGIYRGEIDNWREVGGGDGKIVVVNKAAGRSTLELFVEYFHLDETRIDADVVIGDNEQGVKAVAGQPLAIGYVSIGTGEYDAAHGVPIKLLPVGGVEASVANVRNGTFPLARRLNLVTRDEPAGLTKEFIEFARSSKVHDLIEKLSFVPAD